MYSGHQPRRCENALKAHADKRDVHGWVKSSRCLKHDKSLTAHVNQYLAPACAVILFTVTGILYLACYHPPFFFRLHTHKTAVLVVHSLFSSGLAFPALLVLEATVPATCFHSSAISIVLLEV
jgi:hypothetical protein